MTVGDFLLQQKKGEGCKKPTVGSEKKTTPLEARGPLYLAYTERKRDTQTKGHLA